jgi:hypothetical protein
VKDQERQKCPTLQERKQVFNKKKMTIRILVSSARKMGI